jgi:hypothetical protein
MQEPRPHAEVSELLKLEISMVGFLKLSRF